jgi:beta-glucosidase
VQNGAVRQPDHTYTETGWEVHAPALTDVLLWVRDRYGALPLYITENGAAFYDPPRPVDGVVDDPLRVAYYRDHLRAAHDAIRQGVDLRGYFAWSLLDNYEWSLGYTKRFGIVHVDFATQRRTPKASARFYSRVIASNGAALGD